LKQPWIVTPAILQTVGQIREHSITVPIPLVEAPISINAENIPGTTSTVAVLQDSPVQNAILQIRRVIFIIHMMSGMVRTTGELVLAVMRAVGKEPDLMMDYLLTKSVAIHVTVVTIQWKNPALISFLIKLD
jgi:hypothetical protein